MPTRESTHNRQLIINSQFKKQLLRLKTLANEELNVHFSLDKMVSDKHYRVTVLDQLNGLGSTRLTELVILLKNTPDFPPVAFPHSEIQREIPPQPKKIGLWIGLISALIIVCLAVFISFHNGYIVINRDQIVPPIAPQGPRGGVITTAITAPATQLSAVPLLPPLNKPAPVITLRLHGSNTIGETLAPALLEAYLSSLSVTDMHWLDKGSEAERVLYYGKDNNSYGIELHTHGSTTGFQRLVAGEADISLSSRKITATEIEALAAKQGVPFSLQQELIVGLDGVAIIVHRSNPIAHLSTEQLAKVFSGEIDNWRLLGGGDLVINRYARDNNSGTWDTFNDLLLVPLDKHLNSDTQRVESSKALANYVAQDIAAIGFIGLSSALNSKTLAISATDQSAIIYPSRFTVSTEDYTLSRRLYMYLPAPKHAMAAQFIDFVMSEQGQSVVDRVGLVSQKIKLEQTYQVKNAPQTYNDYAQIASRLSVNFRFKSGRNELNDKAQQDIKRLVDYLRQHSDKRIVLMGFADSLEESNVDVSLHRATQLEKALNDHGLRVTAVEGFGEKLPIASNATELGRSKNRRVEVWVF